MKKTYMKPYARVEYFTLCQSIARNCGYNDESYWGQPTHSDIGVSSTCGWMEVDGTIIWMSTVGCSDAYPEDAEVTEGCYNAPTAANAIFSS